MTENNVSKPVLVTGAGGFLGHAVVQQLRHAGHEVIPVDISNRHDLSGFRHCDIADSSAVDSLLTTHRPETVIHLAAFGAGAAGLLASAEQDPDAAVRINTVAFSALLDACERHGVTRFAWSSSTTVYGPATLYGAGARIREDALLAPFTVYGATKLIAERMAVKVRETGRITTVAIRLPLIYGPNRWYGGTQASWMQFVQAALAGHKGDFAFDASPADWMYVTDAAGVMIAAATAPDVPKAAYNAVGHVASTLEMAQAIRSQTATDSISLSEQPGGVPLALLDGSQIVRDLGFSSKITETEIGIKSYLEALSADEG